MSIAPKRATYRDLLALSDEVRAEVLGGEVTLSPAPLPRHSRTQRSLARFIGGPYDDDDGLGGPGGWWILLEVDVELEAHEIVRPDLAGWHRDRLPEPWDQRPIGVVPDWICEILSPSNVATDRVFKRNLYARAGVRHYWLVDPTSQTLEALRLEGDRWLELGAYGIEDSIRVEPFIEVELELARIFPPA